MNIKTCTWIFAAALVGCGDDGATSASATATQTATTMNPTADPTQGTEPLPTGGESQTGSSSGGLGVSDSQATTSPTEATSTSTSTSTIGETTTGQISASDATSEGSSTGVKQDMGPKCPGMGEPDVSYIWIANSGQGTISKINTETLKEEGRYIVRPDSLGDPSRTSVNLTGDVAVANRSGGLTKVYARSESCAESNGIPGIQTAVDANYLAWGSEECIAWYTPMNYISQRPVAWTPGAFDMEACKYTEQRVWTSGNNLQNGTVDVMLVDGDTGAIETTVTVNGIGPDYFGLYGAAVDAKGNLWASQLGQQSLLFVDIETKDYKIWPMAAGGYGMTVDSKGYVWTCAWEAARFDPMTEQWAVVQASGSGGCMEDGEGTLYMSGSNNNIVAVDTETLALKQTYALPNYVHGISIDFQGYVWGVEIGQNAYRVDPVNGQFETFSNLFSAYTYSDMTGVALKNVSPQ